MSTQLLLTNTLLAIADLPGVAGYIALALTLWFVPLVVFPLRFRLLLCLGLADNDLRVLNNLEIPTSKLGIIQLVLKMFFTAYCSFMQSFQLQSSKVSKDYKRKVQFILNCDTIYFSYIYLTNLKNVPVKTQAEKKKRVALPKPKPPTLLHGEPSCSHPSPALKVRTRNTT